jgi:hypothetical protein
MEQSCQLSALSLQFSDGSHQRGQHALHFDNSARQSLVIQPLQDMKIVYEKKVVFNGMSLQQYWLRWKQTLFASGWLDRKVHL